MITAKNGSISQYKPDLLPRNDPLAYDKAMRAMVLERPGMPLRLQEKEDPILGPGKVLVRVTACGVCRTDLHVVDGDLTEPKLPIIPGHEIVGTVIGIGRDVVNFKEGDRIGIPWLGRTCGHCSHCVSGDENLCDEPGFTGYQIDGGYADMAVAEAHFRSRWLFGARRIAVSS